MDHQTPPYFCWTILYPYKEGASFDFELFAKVLLPEYVEILGDNCIKFEVRKGSERPGAPAPDFLCTVNIWIKSRDRLRESIITDPRMKATLEKIRAFTDLQPIRQIDEVVSFVEMR